MMAQTYAASAAPRVIKEDERERLILEHLPQVRLIARRIQERLPESISLDDLVSTGVHRADLGDRQFRSRRTTSS